MKLLITLCLLFISTTNASELKVKSQIALVFDENNKSSLFDKNSSKIVPIASITKLMTAMVIEDSSLSMDEIIPIVEDNPNIKRSKSRLKINDSFTRYELLQLALMSSENRAALSLGTNYPGGLESFVIAMNNKAKDLDMKDTKFYEPTGLDKNNVSTANDLVKMVIAASNYKLIHKFTTTTKHETQTSKKLLTYKNTNPLVSISNWNIGLSKTGYTKEAGKCLVMQTIINDNPIVIILLASKGKTSRITDAKHVKDWIDFK